MRFRVWVVCGLLCLPTACGRTCQDVVDTLGDLYEGPALGYAAGQYVALWVHAHGMEHKVEGALVAAGTGFELLGPLDLDIQPSIAMKLLAGPAHHLVITGSVPSAILNADGVVVVPELAPYPETAEVSPEPMAALGVDGGFLLAYPDPMWGSRLTLVKQRVDGSHITSSIATGASGFTRVALVQAAATIWLVVADERGMAAVRIDANLAVMGASVLLSPRPYGLAGAASADDRALVISYQEAILLAQDGTITSSPLPFEVRELLPFPGAGYLASYPVGTELATEHAWLDLEGRHLGTAGTTEPSATVTSTSRFAAAGERGLRLHATATYSDKGVSSRIDVRTVDLGGEGQPTDLAVGKRTYVFAPGECAAN